MEEPLVSIIMRNYNEGWALPETLDAVRNQDYTNWELIVIDSGSTDGSPAMIRDFVPRHFVEIPPGTYVPGKVLNEGVRLAQSDLCIFLNADATPQNKRWLRTLVEALQKPGVGACFGRQIARPDCKAVFAHDYDRCFGPERESASWDHFFSMVSSGLRREVWEERGFREDLQYAEDDEYTRWCVEAGYGIEFVPDSVVMHSHNYTPKESFYRSFGDARAQGKAFGKMEGMGGWCKNVPVGWAKDIVKDIRFCVKNRRLSEFPYAVKVRWNQRCGRYKGLFAGMAEAHNPPA